MIRAIGVAVLVPLVVVFASGCDPSSWDPVNTGKDVPSSFGPCGSWVDCSAHEVITNPNDRCCMPTTACAVDDGGPYCAADPGYDPADPVTWGRHTPGKPKRFARSATGQ